MYVYVCVQDEPEPEFVAEELDESDLSDVEVGSTLVPLV